MKLRKGTRLAAALLMVLAMLTAVMCSALSAAAADAVTSTVKVNQTVNGELEDDNVVYNVIPAEKDNPMPSDLTGAQFAIVGTGSANFTFSFTKPGVYEYTVKSDLDSSTFGFMVKNGANGGLSVTPYTCVDDKLNILPNGVELNFVIEGAVPATSATTVPAITPATSPATVRPSTVPAYSTAANKHAGFVNTEDPYQLILWAGLLILALAGIIIIFVIAGKKRRKGEDDQ